LKVSSLFSWRLDVDLDPVNCNKERGLHRYQTVRPGLSAGRQPATSVKLALFIGCQLLGVALILASFLRK